MTPNGSAIVILSEKDGIKNMFVLFRLYLHPPTAKSVVVNSFLKLLAEQMKMNFTKL
jgi:hypothetical protein